MALSWHRESFTRGELGFDEAPALEDLLEDAPLNAIWGFNRSLYTDEAGLVERSIHSGPLIVLAWEVDNRKIDCATR